MRSHLTCSLGALLLLVAFVPPGDVPVPSAAAPRSERPAPLPTPAHPDLADQGSALFQRYCVYDAAYYASVDATRPFVDRPLAAGEVRPWLVPLGPTFGRGGVSSPHATPLAVRTRSGAPVTFLAPDFGSFPNGERCITVRADAEGVARTRFSYGATATHYRVVAHSPEALGQIVFHLQAIDTDGRGEGGR